MGALDPLTPAVIRRTPASAHNSTAGAPGTVTPIDYPCEVSIGAALHRFNPDLVQTGDFTLTAPAENMEVVPMAGDRVIIGSTSIIYRIIDVRSGFMSIESPTHHTMLVRK